MTVDEFVSQLERARKSGPGWTARCPAHEDRSPSLSVREGDDGRVLVHCFGGCTTDKICAALGLHVTDLFPGEPIDWNRFKPRTPEERQAADLRRLRRRVLALELDQRRAARTMFRMAVLIAAMTHDDDPYAVLDRFWAGAVEELEQEASAAAEAYCSREASP